MNRAVAIALSALCVALSAQAGLAPAGHAQVPEAPEAKQRRIDTFQERRLIFEQTEEDGRTTYTLRQGPDPIYDVDFVELMDDPSLTHFWLGERNRDWTFWLGTGAVAVPAGTLLFVNNFQGQGPLALFADPARPEAANVSDWRTFTLSVLGVAVAAYGTVNLSRWVLEALDLAHPNRLDEDSIAPRVEAWNETLRQRLNLDPEDIPEPPTPRPSVSPSPSPGFPPDPGGVIPNPPSPPVDAPGDYPMGGPPEMVPAPLPVISPGMPLPSPFPSPSVLPSAEPFDIPSPTPAP